jgi:CRP/FNR family transcriptional regulator, anaerobic regulatory protein
MDFLEKIRHALASISPTTEEEWKSFASKITLKHFRKGDFLCRAGQVENYVYFLNEGTTRHYFIKEGKELTVDFQFEGAFVSAYYSFLSREPSPIWIEALSDTEACSIHHKLLYQYYDEYKAGERMGRLIAEFQYTKRLKREIELMSMTAEERYARLMEQNPRLVSGLSVKHLSSYLGIHPESLSRIRKQYVRN